MDYGLSQKIQSHEYRLSILKQQKIQMEQMLFMLPQDFSQEQKDETQDQMNKQLQELDKQIQEAEQDLQNLKSNNNQQKSAIQFSPLQNQINCLNELYVNKDSRPDMVGVNWIMSQKACCDFDSSGLSKEAFKYICGSVSGTSQETIDLLLQKFEQLLNGQEKLSYDQLIQLGIPEKN